MPLKCFRNNKPIFARDLESETLWDELRKEKVITRLIHFLSGRPTKNSEDGAAA